MTEQSASRKSKNDMNDIRPPSGRNLEPAFLENLKHCGIVRQNLGYQLQEPRFACDAREVAQQGRADTLSLMLVVDRKGHLGSAWLRQDISSPAHDRRLPVFLEDSHQGDVTHEVDVDEKIDLPVRKAALEGEEATIQGLLACTSDGREKAVPIVGPEGANFEASPVA